MTWAKFKELVEANGVKDEMEISWIDVGRFYDEELTVNIEDNYFTVSE